MQGSSQNRANTSAGASRPLWLAVVVVAVMMVMVVVLVVLVLLVPLVVDRSLPPTRRSSR